MPRLLPNQSKSDDGRNAGAKICTIGRRTGVDVKAGKDIRVDDKGFENFTDYWTDSDEGESDQSYLAWKNGTSRSTLQLGPKVPERQLRSMSPFTSPFVSESSTLLSAEKAPEKTLQSRVALPAGNKENMSNQINCVAPSQQEAGDCLPELGVDEVQDALDSRPATAQAEHVKATEEVIAQVQQVLSRSMEERDSEDKKKERRDVYDVDSTAQTHTAHDQSTEESTVEATQESEVAPELEETQESEKVEKEERHDEETKEEETEQSEMVEQEKEQESEIVEQEERQKIELAQESELTQEQEETEESELAQEQEETEESELAQEQDEHQKQSERDTEKLVAKEDMAESRGESESDDYPATSQEEEISQTSERDTDTQTSAKDTDSQASSEEIKISKESVQVVAEKNEYQHQDKSKKVVVVKSSHTIHKESKMDSESETQSDATSRVTVDKTNSRSATSLLTEGEVTGSITRIDGSKNALNQPSSALMNFRTRKRLTYSAGNKTEVLVSVQSVRQTGEATGSKVSENALKGESPAIDSEKDVAQDIGEKSGPQMSSRNTGTEVTEKDEGHSDSKDRKVVQKQAVEQVSTVDGCMNRASKTKAAKTKLTLKKNMAAKQMVVEQEQSEYDSSFVSLRKSPRNSKKAVDKHEAPQPKLRRKSRRGKDNDEGVEKNNKPVPAESQRKLRRGKTDDEADNDENSGNVVPTESPMKSRRKKKDTGANKGAEKPHKPASPSPLRKSRKGKDNVEADEDTEKPCSAESPRKSRRSKVVADTVEQNVDEPIQTTRATRSKMEEISTQIDEVVAPASALERDLSPVCKKVDSSKSVDQNHDPKLTKARGRRGKGKNIIKANQDDEECVEGKTTRSLRNRENVLKDNNDIVVTPALKATKSMRKSMRLQDDMQEMELDTKELSLRRSPRKRHQSKSELTSHPSDFEEKEEKGTKETKASVGADEKAVRKSQRGNLIESVNCHEEKEQKSRHKTTTNKPKSSGKIHHNLVDASGDMQASEKAGGPLQSKLTGRGVTLMRDFMLNDDEEEVETKEDFSLHLDESPDKEKSGDESDESLEIPLQTSSVVTSTSAVQSSPKQTSVGTVISSPKKCVASPEALDAYVRIEPVPRISQTTNIITALPPTKTVPQATGNVDKGSTGSSPSYVADQTLEDVQSDFEVDDVTNNPLSPPPPPASRKRKSTGEPPIAAKQARKTESRKGNPGKQERRRRRRKVSKKTDDSSSEADRLKEKAGIGASDKNDTRKAYKVRRSQTSSEQSKLSKPVKKAGEKRKSSDSISDSENLGKVRVSSHDSKEGTSSSEGEAGATTAAVPVNVKLRRVQDTTVTLQHALHTPPTVTKRKRLAKTKQSASSIKPGSQCVDHSSLEKDASMVPATCPETCDAGDADPGEAAEQSHADSKPDARQKKTHRSKKLPKDSKSKAKGSRQKLNPAPSVAQDDSLSEVTARLHKALSQPDHVDNTAAVGGMELSQASNVESRKTVDGRERGDDEVSFTHMSPSMEPAIDMLSPIPPATGLHAAASSSHHAAAPPPSYSQGADSSNYTDIDDDGDDGPMEAHVEVVAENTGVSKRKRINKNDQRSRSKTGNKQRGVSFAAMRGKKGRPSSHLKAGRRSSASRLSLLTLKHEKIIVPAEAEATGSERYPRRTRVKPLNWFLSERVNYQPDDKGLPKVAGIHSPTPFDDAWAKKHTKRQPHRKTTRKGSSRDLSVHTTVPEDFVDSSVKDIPVLVAGTETETTAKCLFSHKEMELVNPSGQKPSPSDPLLLCKMMKDSHFSLGQLIIRPLEMKGLQMVRKDKMLFIVKEGKLLVTIHRTSSIIETDGVFSVPAGNAYSIKNLRKEDAKLWFCQIKGDN